MNIFQVEYEQYQKSALAERLKLKFSEKPYYKKYAAVRFLTLIASYLFNVFSSLTASTLVYFFLLGLSGSIYFSIACTVVFVILLEAFKRFTSSIFFKEALQYRAVNVPLLLFGIGLLLLSLAFSFYGSKELVKGFSSSPVLIDTKEHTRPLQEQISSIDNQIAEARKTQWRGTTTNTSQRTIETLSQSKLALQSRVIAIEQKASDDNSALNAENKQIVTVKAEYFALLTFVLEFAFFLCAFYLEYYDFRSYKELESNSALKTKPVAQAVKQVLPTIEKAAMNKSTTTKSTPIINSKPPKVSTKAERKCGNCSKDISHKRSDAKYCDADCRKSAWAKANEREPFLKAKKG